MRRGEVWIAAGGGDYAGKPRPVVVIQDDHFDATDSVTVCGFTTDPTKAPLFRLEVTPDEQNGLDEESRIMSDEVTTVRRTRLAERIGRLSDEDIARLNRALMVFLGLAASPRTVES